MNGHLSAEQICKVVLGDSPAEDSEHSRACGACSDEITRVEAALSGFRQSVRNWSERAGVRGYQPQSHAGGLFSAFAMDGNRLARRATGAGLSSLLLHGAAVAMVLSFGMARVATAPYRMVTSTLTFYLPPVTAKPSAGGGGGGGAKETLPASRGRLAPSAPRQFTPPSAHPVTQAELLMPPSLVIPAGVPDITSAVYGDPFSTAAILSNGPGSNGGIGGGDGGGIGQGKGPGAGPGANGGYGGGVEGGVYSIGGRVSAPRILTKVEPEYSEQARKARFQGTVVLSVIVDEKGRTRDVNVIGPAGMGLDEKALEAVRKWVFQPGMLNGKPVAVRATIEVGFRLL